jgi:hypothetical protein
VYQYGLQKAVIDYCNEAGSNSADVKVLLVNFDPEMVILSLSKTINKLVIADGQYIRSDIEGKFIIPFSDNKWWRLVTKPTVRLSHQEGVY